MRLGRYLKGNFGVPSVFDVGVVLFISILPVLRVPGLSTYMMRGIWFIFGTIALMLIGLCSREIRLYKCVPLGLLCFISLVHVFWHSWYVSPFSIDFESWCLLNEGFIYIFFGSFLICTIVRYAKSYGWYYIPLVSILLIFFNTYVFDSYLGWSMTPILACSIALVFVLLKLKKYYWFLYVFMSGLFITVFKWDWIIYKFKMRPVMWKIVIKELIDSKWLGSGFDHSVTYTLNGFVWSGSDDGWAYVHNDLLEMGRALGVFGMICVAWFFGRLLIKGRPGLAYFFVLAGCIASLFQRVMFLIEKN